MAIPQVKDGKKLENSCKKPSKDSSAVPNLTPQSCAGHSHLGHLSYGKFLSPLVLPFSIRAKYIFSGMSFSLGI